MTVPSGSAADPWPIRPLLAALVDDTSLLQPRTVAPGVDAVVSRYLAARDGHYGGLVGRLVCPASQLPAVVTELARSAPSRPADLGLVVDTGLGAVPKALSTVFSRSSLLTPSTVECAAPPDVDGIWLERVSEFVPDEVTPVVEPRRPVEGDAEAHEAWLAAIRKVAEHGCTPKIRMGGPRPSDVPTVDDVHSFLQAGLESGAGGISAQGLDRIVREEPNGSGGRGRHGLLNLIVAVARMTGVSASPDPVADALESTDGEGLARELDELPDKAVEQVRTVLPRCGVDPDPVPIADLVALGLLD
ncbi:hypothetical protein WIS52_12315 [Pseudonocardia nematodicida]|uniref:Uncharacterized protein n=1 Tax=Pseudonocardia nematodicida TaxID=1206997 RepID=A0ABV1KCC3_9PSEU